MANSSYNVLAVDDEKFSLTIIRSCLKDSMYNLVTCHEVSNALEEFKKGNFDVVLLDVMMGTIDGFELRRLIRKYNNKVPIIFLTSLLDDIDSSLINQISADQYSYYLNKSFKKQQLKDKIEQAVRMYRQEDENSKFYKQIDQDLRLAQEVQRVLLPVWCSLNNRMMSTYLYEPCLRVSGDSFDIHELTSGRFLFFIGDIAGHGVRAALYMSAIQSFLKTIRVETSDSVLEPHTVLNKISTFFNIDLQGESYMTCLVAIIDYNTNHMVFQTAGHPSLIRLSAAEKKAFEVDTEDKGGCPIGWFKNANYLEEDNVELDFDPRDIFLGYTDGLMDLENEAGESLDSQLLFNLLSSFLEDGRPLHPLPYLLRSSLEQIGYTVATDDVTVVEVRKNPSEICKEMQTPENCYMEMVGHSKAEISKSVQRFSEFAEKYSGDFELATKIELLLSEFLNNVVDHDTSGNGSSLRAGIVIYMRMEEPDLVRVVVQDRDAKWEKDQLQLNESPAEVLERANRNMAVSGRGLAIIRTITSSISRKHYSGLNRTEFRIKAGKPW